MSWICNCDWIVPNKYKACINCGKQNYGQQCRYNKSEVKDKIDFFIPGFCSSYDDVEESRKPKDENELSPTFMNRLFTP